MADFTSNAYANVYVNNEQARSRLAELTAQAESFRKKLDEARLSGDVKGALATQKQLNKIEKEAQNVVKAYFDVDRVMKNLSKSGVNDLRKALAQLQKEVNNGKIARGSKQWDSHVQKIRTLKKEIERIDTSMRIIPTRWQRITESFNRNFATVTSLIASLTGIQYTLRKAREDFAHLDDVYSDVMKTTGMTRDAVVEMNETFKKLDTRTSREELNKMSEELGRMGVAEIASRAYNIVLSRAAEKTDAFAKVMGKSTEEVTRLINTNPVEFFLKFSESMRGMSAVDTAKTLKELSINAEGANKIIGAASNNTERFRQILELSNKSFQEGTSVINEFNIKNNNAQAQLEKAKKVFFDASVELGERLNPAMLKL